MIRISQQQGFERWDTLPQVLRDALCAEEVADAVENICTEQHIPSEKRPTVSRLAGYVLFGFMHPEDLAKELADALKIDIRITTAIADAINRRVFLPLKADIDAVYQPPGISRPAGGVATSGGGPKMLEEIRPITPIGARMGTPSVSRPAFSETGWSRANSTAVGSPPSLPRPIMGDLQKTESGKIVMPPRPPENSVSNPFGSYQNTNQPSARGGGTPAPAPFFVQTDMAAQPLTKKPNFTMSSGSLDRIANLTSKPPAPPPRPAVIEFGTTSSAQAPQQPKPLAPKSVNYSDRPIEAGRQVNEVTANNIPKPPVPPAPPGK